MLRSFDGLHIVFSHFYFLGVLWVRRSYVRLSFYSRKRLQNYWLGFWWWGRRNPLRISHFYSFRLCGVGIGRHTGFFSFLLPRASCWWLIRFFDVNHLFFSPFLWLVLACAYIITLFSYVSLRFCVLISILLSCVSLLLYLFHFAFSAMKCVLFYWREGGEGRGGEARQVVGEIELNRESK